MSDATQRLLALDFETHWNKGSYSVKDLGCWLYCQDRRFKALTVATHDGQRSLASTPETFDWSAVHGATLLAHNAPFDRAVFTRLQEQGIVPAAVQPAGWLDTAAMCAYCGVPRDLAGACKQLLGIDVDKSTRDALGEGSLFAQDTALTSYCAKDAELCWALHARLGAHWPAEEQALATITDDMGRRGMRVDMAALEAALARLTQLREELRGSIPFTPPTSTQKLTAWCLEHGYTPPRSTSKNADIEDMGDVREVEVGVVVRHIQRFRSVNRTLTVVEAMRDRVGTDGRLRYELKYFGAGQTGRWSGGGGLNMQNFNRAVVEGVDLRALIVPEPGHSFVIADYAQIEARVLLWLAREMPILDMIRGGMDLYEAAARRMLGYSDPRPLKQVDPNLRQLSKGMTLGLGFGMGAAKFVAAAKVLAGIEIDFSKAQDSVRRFRNANRRVVDLWDRLADAFRRNAGKPCYRLPLPSGRLIRYWNPQASGGEDASLTASEYKGAPACGLHRGLLAENMVQAVARDLLAAAWLRCVRAGRVPVLSCHDELVFEVPTPDAPAAAKEIERLMLVAPAWPMADALPLAVEVKLADRYGK